MTRDEFDGLINALERITDIAEEREINNMYELITREYHRRMYLLSTEDCQYIERRIQDASDLIDIRREKDVLICLKCKENEAESGEDWCIHCINAAKKEARNEPE